MAQGWAEFAREHGFKIAEIRPQMWCVLDQPNTPFWFAFFTSEEIAAKAVCRANGMILVEPQPRHVLQED